MSHLWEVSVGTNDIDEPNVFYVKGTPAEIKELVELEKANCDYGAEKVVCNELCTLEGMGQKFKDAPINTVEDMRKEMIDLGYDMGDEAPKP